MISHEIDMTVIFSFSALIISSLTLWFSHLKGPDLRLCNEPKTELEEWTRDTLKHYVSQNYIPSPLNLVPSAR